MFETLASTKMWWGIYKFAAAFYLCNCFIQVTVLVPFFQLLRIDYQTGNVKGAHILAANKDETTFSLWFNTGHYLNPHQLTKIWFTCHVPVFAKICNQKQLQLAAHSIGTKSFLCFLEMNYSLHIRKVIQRKIHKITGWWNETEWLLKTKKNSVYFPIHFEVGQCACHIVVVTLVYLDLQEI